MSVILAVVHAALAASPVGGRLTLDAMGAFQSYDYQSGWLDADEQVLREELRTTFNGYLLDQAFANYRLGVAVDNRTLFSAESAPTSRLGYSYDGRFSFWQETAVPLVLYGSHQTSIPQMENNPSNEASTDIYGYQASLVLRGLPKLDTSGRYQVLESVTDGERTRQVVTNVKGSLFQSGKSNHERGSIDWETVSGPTEGSYRDRRAVSLDIDARLSDDVEVIARTDAHRHQTELGGESFVLGNTDSDALVRYRIADRTNGVVFIEQHESTLDDAQYSGAVAGAQLAHRFEGGLRTEGEVGATYDTVDVEGDITEYVGEFARGNLGHSGSGSWGTYDASVQTGVAHFTEVDQSGGLQVGGSVQGTYGRQIGGVLHAFAGGELSGQSDSSGLEQDFFGRGWRGGFTTRRFLGLSVGADASGSQMETLEHEEGDSERLRATGHATLQLAAFLTANYSLVYDELALDEERSVGLGHVAQLDVEVTGTLHLSAAGYQTRWVTNDDRPTEWWRVEGTVRWQLLGMNLEGRASHDFTIVDGDERGATKVLVTASRRFGWDL